jgi:uncharacterized protein (UPF0335 family)
MKDTYEVTADELRQIIERIEHLEAEKASISDQIKEVYAEAKGRGYETKAIRALVALRKKRAEEVAEMDAILELYKQALGMA